MQATGTFHKLSDLPTVSVNRRTLLKRAGLVGVALPFGGALFGACGSNDKQPTLAAAQPSTATSPVVVSTTPVEITVTAKDLSFTPTELKAQLNQPVRLTFVNAGAIEHDWSVTDLPVTNFKVVSKPDTLSAHISDQLSQSAAKGIAYAGAAAGQQMVVEFTPTKAGDFMMMCTIPGHADAGMHGTVEIEGGAASGAAPAATTPMTDDHVMPSSAPAIRAAGTALMPSGSETPGR